MTTAQLKAGKSSPLSKKCKLLLSENRCMTQYEWRLIVLSQSSRHTVKRK